MHAGIKNQSLNHLAMPHLIMKPIIRIKGLVLLLNYFVLGGT